MVKSTLDTGAKYWETLFLSVIGVLTIYFFLAGINFAGENSYRFERYFLSGLSLVLLMGVGLNSFTILKKVQEWKIVFGLCFLGEMIFALYHHNFFSFKKVFIDLSLFFLFFVSLPKASDNKYLKISCLVFLAVICIMSLPLPFLHFWHDDGTYRGAFIHRNALGYFLIPLLILVLNAKIKPAYKYAFHFIFYVLMFVAVSRSMLIASLFVNVLYLVLAKKSKIWIGLVILVHALFVLYWSNLLRLPMMNGADFAGNNGRVFQTSTSERWQVIEQGLHKYAESPVLGLGNIFVANSTFRKDLDMNNFFLSHLISYGIFPSITILMIFSALFMMSGIRVRLLLINLLAFAAFQAFFDYFQTAYFYITVLMIYFFNYFDQEDDALTQGKTNEVTSY